MINEVRETVMAILSKDNNGYITPHEFNLFAKQAQLEIFEDYFVRHQKDTILTHQRNNNTGVSDKRRISEEMIDRFSTYDTLTASTGSQFVLPTNYFTINSLIYNNSASIEYISKHKLLQLNNSKLTAPSSIYPVYTFGEPVSGEDSIVVYPTSIVSDVSIYYTRYPVDPKWTYNMFTGDPLFDNSAPDYQDFELTRADFNDLVIKICLYAGVNIRENEVVAAMTNMDMMNKNQGE